MSVRVIRVTSNDGAIVAPQWLAKAEAVHRELRPQIPADYASKMHRVFAGGGRMIVAVDGDGGGVTGSAADRVVGLALYRIYEDTFNGTKLYCDDLVTTEQNLVNSVQTYLGVLRDQWQAVTDIAGLLQTRDLFSSGEEFPVAPVPELGGLLPCPR